MRQFLCFVFAMVLAVSQSDSVFASTKGGSIKVASVSKTKSLKIVNPKGPPSIPKTPPIINPKGPVGLPGHPLARHAVRHAVFHPHTHTVWSHYAWLPAHRCYGYYCSTTCRWFYLCQSQNVYLPIESIAIYPPMPVENVINLNVNVVQTAGSPALPVGAVALPPGVTPPIVK